MSHFPFTVHIEHTAGSFLARTSAPETARDALVFVANEATERWELDIIDVRIATQADHDEAQGQITDMDHDA